jgi:hypothetical protein
MRCPRGYQLNENVEYPRNGEEYELYGEPHEE